MAYIKELFRPRCRRCYLPKPATHAVYNRQNALNGEFCRLHAAEYCRELSAMEAQHDRDEAQQ